MIRIGRLKLEFIALMILFYAHVVFASESLKVEVQPDSVGVGETVQIILTIQSTDDFESSEPQVPDISGMKLLQAQNGGQSSSTRMNIINGKTEFMKSVQQQFIFIYQAVQSGVVTIPSMSVSVNGKTLTSAPQKISISKTATQNPQNNRRGGSIPGRPQFGQPDPDPFSNEEDMFEQLMKQREKMIEEMQRQMGIPQGRSGRSQFGQPQQLPNLKMDVNTNEAFFLVLDTDKTTAYEGEQITANWYLYTRGRVESLDRAKFPDLKGFWKEIIEEVPALNFEDVIVNNLPYQRALLASHALFPIKAGVSAIDEFKIKAKVRLPTTFGWGQLNEYTKASRRLPLKILPLPVEDRPKSFSGAVGQFQIQTQIDGLQFPAQQPISLKVRFEGQGNAKLIELPGVDWPEGLEVYDTKSESKFFKNGQSFKEFEILLLAQKTGDIKIPQINFSYFDPQLKKYVTKSTEEFSVKITEALKGNGGNSLKLNSISKSAQPVEKNYLPVTELKAGVLNWNQNRYYFLFLMTLVVMLSVVLKPLWMLRKISFSPNLKFKVHEKLNQLEQANKTKDFKRLGAESVNLLYLLTASLAQEKNSSEDWSALIYKMPENYRLTYEQKLNDLFDYFQTVGFAPESMREQILNQRPMSQMLDELRSTAGKIVSELS